MGSNTTKQMSSNMSQNLQAQKQFQIQLIVKQRQMMLATRRAMNRQIFKYYSTFMGTMAVLLTIYALRTGNKSRLLAGIPFGVLLAYQYDLAYGQLFSRARIGTFDILKDQSQMLYPPWNNGILSVKEYEESIPYSVVSSHFDSSYNQLK